MGRKYDPTPLEDFSMWACFQKGGVKGNPQALKDLVYDWIQIITQKTAGQRRIKNKDISWDNLERIKMGILVEATCLVVSGDIDKLIAEEKESKK